jgi:hypothetical protein
MHLTQNTDPMLLYSVILNKLLEVLLLSSDSRAEWEHADILAATIPFPINPSMIK